MTCAAGFRFVSALHIDMVVAALIVLQDIGNTLILVQDDDIRGYCINDFVVLFHGSGD